jgi:hypothetical protein
MRRLFLNEGFKRKEDFLRNLEANASGCIYFVFATKAVYE